MTPAHLPERVPGSYGKDEKISTAVAQLLRYQVEWGKKSKLE